MLSASSNTSGTTKKTSVGRRVSSVTKDSNKTSRTRTSQSLRVNVPTNQRTTSASSTSKSAKVLISPTLAPLRPPDPTLFIQAGTTGVRHLFPIHLTIDEETNGNQFARPISRLRSRTPTTELCSNVEMIRNICASIKHLQHFDVSHNDLVELPLDMSLLVELESLNCSHNSLTDLSELFEQWKYLKDFDLSFNQLKHLPAMIYTLKSLVRLNCEHNSLSQLETTFLNLKRLKVFIADHNQFESIDTIDFSLMKKLEYFHLAQNRLTKFPRGLHQLHHLKNVNLSNNRLKSFPIDLLLVNTLDVLNLSHNLISKLPPMPIAYKRTSMIFSIDLSFNQLNKFYTFLLFIAFKVDVSQNKIRMLSNDFLKRLTNELITSRELKIHNNPITQPALPTEIFHETTSSTLNVLRMIRNCYDEQQLDANTRQGFKISIIGPKNSGKTALANCLEEFLPLSLEDIGEDKQQRFAYEVDFEVCQQMLTIRMIHQCPFRLTTSIDSPPQPPAPSLPAVKAPHLDNRKRRNRNNSFSRQSSSMSNPLTAIVPLTFIPPPPAESTRVIPLAIFDFNGSPEYNDPMYPFLDTQTLHLICVAAHEFHQQIPKNLEEIFTRPSDQSSSPVIDQLLKILQILSDKASKNKPLVIIPIATFIDLYDNRPKEEQTEVIEKFNQFFRLFLRFRREQIKNQIDAVQALPMISSSLSDRLKTWTNLLNISIQIEPCQPLSSVTFHGMEELVRNIQRVVLTEKTAFPHVERILPTLWADANQYIDSLADVIPVPYLLWEDFTERVISKHGLGHLIEQIVISLHEEGKIFVFTEIGTNDRVVFLRPSWLLDLLYNLFRLDMRTTFLDYETNELFAMNNLQESRFQLLKRDFLQHGVLHNDLLKIFWSNLIQKKDSFYHLWLTLMRFLLIAYPKMTKGQLRRLIHVKTPEPLPRVEKKLPPVTEMRYDEIDMQFDYAIVPRYLPSISVAEQHDELKRFQQFQKYLITVRYTSSALPEGLFHRYSVSAIFRLNIVYRKHWNNFIIGEHEEKDVRFVMETDHRTYFLCSCGTNLIQQPFEEIWNVLMPILNHCEEMFFHLAPGNRFDRFVQCPFCHQFSFMGEWITPKELQCSKTKTCSSCGQNVDTARLVQPNESKRRSEELLKRIRERRAKTGVKETDDVPATNLLVSPV